MSRPEGFARGPLGMQLYPKQAEVLRLIEPHGAAVAFVSCNEGGKTSRVICAAILWHLARFPRGKIVSTSGSWRQIQDQLVPALRRYEARFPRWSFHKTPKIDTPDPNGFYLGFSTNDAGLFEGFHGENEREPLMIIVDEAKTPGTDIFQAIDRCKPHRLLLASSPGLAQGKFYDAFTKDAKLFDRVKQRADDCPHWTEEEKQKLREKWAGAPEYVGSLLDAEFIQESDDVAISLRIVNQALGSPPRFNSGEEAGFCDFGGGAGQNVFAVRRGNKIEIADAWRDPNTMSACGRFIRNFQKSGMHPHQLAGDGDGMGQVFLDRLGELGWVIGRVYGGRDSVDPHYFNVAAETWIEGGKAMEAGEWILPDDPELVGQLTTRKKAYDSKARLKLESKEDMAKRGLPSPDKADSVLGVMRRINFRGGFVGGTNAARHGAPWEEDDSGRGMISDDVMAGFNAGSY